MTWEVITLMAISLVLGVSIGVAKWLQEPILLFFACLASGAYSFFVLHQAFSEFLITLAKIRS